MSKLNYDFTLDLFIVDPLLSGGRQQQWNCVKEFVTFIVLLLYTHNLNWSGVIQWFCSVV